MRDTLAAQWSQDPGCTVVPAGSGLAVVAWDGQVFDPPIRLEITEADLTPYIQGLDAGELAQIWPDKTAEWSGMALLAVSLEALLAAPGRPRAVRLVGNELVGD